MAGAVTDRELTAPPASRVRYALATREDDPAIRRLLRENPMKGDIALTFEREPDYFRGQETNGTGDQTIVAFEGGRVVCMGRCSIRKRYVNGGICRVGYLADLRLDASARSRFDILRRGYRFFHEQAKYEPADYYFTSIAADNIHSIRFLERGLPGMPAYKFVSDFVTLLIPVPQGGRPMRRLVRSAKMRKESSGFKNIRASKERVDEIVSCLNFNAARHQFASHWSEEDFESLENLGLAVSDFQLVLNGGKVIACAALWNQREFKQTVIRGYSAKISLARPWINLAAKLSGTPQLPGINSTLAFGFVSPLALGLDDSQSLLMLIEFSLCAAMERAIEYVVVGFAADDPRLTTVRKYFRCREYQTRLYGVQWPDAAAATPAFDGRQFSPDIALL